LELKDFQVRQELKDCQVQQVILVLRVR
jgi:hypothetical protein